MTALEALDRIFARLLWVRPQPPEQADGAPEDDSRDDTASAPAARAFGLALLISGLRCTLQYLILPAGLPLLGLASGVSLPLVILLDGLALVLLVRSLRYFWRIRHPRRFDMLPLSGLILLIIVGSLGYDIWELLH